ncbi:SpoIIE family protein phosphatase [Streptomyces sp. NPDC004629]|uniref:SpoIIE family protein phosphatase n=1 Tax=Streptomyces sp. NPDC004629 TaxID=3364705 RepID=UPI0036B92988
MSSTWDDAAALAKAHDRLLSGGTVGKAVRKPILSSWRRCHLQGVAANGFEAPYDSDLDFGGKLAYAAGPVLDHLESVLSGMPVTVFLTDERARIMERRGGEPCLNRYLERLQVAPCFGIPEELAGTNGIGTALAVAGPAFVVGREHFADVWRRLACAGAPVRDPLSGQFLGVLDLTCRDRDADRAMLEAVTEASHAVEQGLLDGVTARERALLEAYQDARSRGAVGGRPSGTLLTPWDVLGPCDRHILEERATELISSGQAGLAEVRLSGGRAVILVSRPIESSSGVTGVAVEAAFPGVGVHPLRPRQSPQAPETRAPGSPELAETRAPGTESLVVHGHVSGSPPVAASSAAPAAPAGRWLLAVGEPVIGRLALRARQRLGLIADAGSRIGTTLDVSRTAEELTEVAVPRFADFAAVDLPDSVLLGEEPIRVDGPLRRVALGGPYEASHLKPLGDLITFAASTPQAQALVTSEPVRERTLSRAPGWMADDPVRGSKILGAGVHSLIAVPMLARGTALGVASFYRSRAHGPFEEDDLVLAEELVGRAAVCIDNARRFTREHAMALALQKGMLPSGLPVQHAVDAAHRYLPAASGVGGDWFDVIPLSGARVALVVGDVVGHGLHAAATMGRLRTAVHNFSALDLAADEILTQLDDLVIRLDLDDQRAGKSSMGMVGTSCLYAVYDPGTRRCTLGRAGHPPPAVVLPDGTVAFPDVPAGPPLGLGGLPFETVDVELPEGSLLVLYTDGLIEHLGGGDLERGLDRLQNVLALRGRTPEQVCKALGALVPAEPSDDIALLVARTRALGAAQLATWDLPADPPVVPRVREEVIARLADWGLGELGFTTELVVSELVTNAIRYGGEPIQLRLLHDSTLICEVSDGSSLAPRMRRARTMDEGGRGLFLVAQLTQRWGTRYTTQGKVIWVEQSLPGQPV